MTPALASCWRATYAVWRARSDSSCPDMRQLCACQPTRKPATSSPPAIHARVLMGITYHTQRLLIQRIRWMAPLALIFFGPQGLNIAVVTCGSRLICIS